MNEERPLSDITDIEEERRARRAYRRSVHDAAHGMRMFQTELIDMATQLAFAGPMRREMEGKPVGAVVQVDEETLLATNDAKVRALVEVSRAIDAAVETLYDVKKDG